MSGAAAGRGVEGSEPCPCGRGEPYDACCGPLHAGRAAPTAERLMRSRYSAFALGLGEYLLLSWDPATRPASMELDEAVVWKRLFIERVEAGGPFDAEGFVTFTAVGRGAEGRFEQRERSRFGRVDGRWVYTDGETAD
ncbi:YchJ family protein [Leucobacter celer]|uniref:YchJ family protein n=1 Tax=Leucobacter celer TaxID=668625 RepID=UPI0006A7C1FB|nr:YchJ family metal-binding protein [Leucobacter celer]